MPHHAQRIETPLEVLVHRGAEAVVFKPAGLSSERGQGDRGDCVARRAEVQLSWPQCWLAHRLDRPTRGIMVLAGSSESAALHSEEIRRGSWTKWYFARIPIHHNDRPASGLVGDHRAYLKRAGRLASLVRSGGAPSRLSILAVEPSQDNPSEAHALIRLDTGRFHQIRVMLAGLGFPLVGDIDYGAPATSKRATMRTLEYPEIDLEAVALRVVRSEQAAIYRLRHHPARQGVSEELERALDRALEATGPPRPPTLEGDLNDC